MTKGKSEGIELLSMYADDDEDDVDEPHHQPHLNDAVSPLQNDAQTVKDRGFNHESSIGSENVGAREGAPPNLSENLTPVGETTTPRGVEVEVSRKERLTIVDYGHDEAALSPEAEKGESMYADTDDIEEQPPPDVNNAVSQPTNPQTEEGEMEGTGRVMFGADLHMSNGEYSEQVTLGTVRGLTPSTHATPQSSGQHDDSQPEAMDYTATALVDVPENVEVGPKEPEDAALDAFLPPLPKSKCSDELQEKIVKFLTLRKTTGRSYNAEVRNRKEYRNPDFLLHAVTYQDIDQIGTCFSKDVFDPHGYDKSDFYDEIEADMKREMERKEQEKKKSQKIEYISGGTQGGTLPTPKVNLPVPGVSSGSGGGLLSVPAAVDSVVREGRPNKKSKWDKVDGDRRNPLPTGGADFLSATLLSAANAGTGYSAFAQQRRREAEVRKSSDRKLERRT
uniref:SAP30-binding protein n=1 Tax=Daucus carota subsp. sativus TaxID=79200 RepID=A0A164WGL0_DAUCS